MALVLNVGGGAISLVQNGTGSHTTTTNPTASLPAPSTWGTTLVALLGNSTGVTTTATSVDPTVTVGWRQSAVIVTETTNAHIEVWVYENNIGGITTATFTAASAFWWTHISEWNNARLATHGLFGETGSATATSGTTLNLVLSAAISETNDLLIAAWIQLHAANTATYTTPASWTRLFTDGATSLAGHIDAEYILNPPLTTNAVTLTSNRTTTSAAGIELGFVHPGATVDQTAFIEYGSMTMKRNTLDFNLIDPATVPAIGDNVAMTTPTWSGRVISVGISDIVDLRSGHRRITVSAINQTVATPGAAPYGLSDNPDLSTTFGYRSLSVSNILNADGTYTLYGTLETETTGFAAAQTFALTSSNLGYSATSFLISNVTVRWQGSAYANPTYFVEFGTATNAHRILHS